MDVQSGTVFIVDDDAGARRSIAALAASLGADSESFASAEEFLAQWNGATPGCLVLDLRLSGMSGAELQQRLVQTGPVPPIIFVTAYADVRTAVRVMEAGAVTLLEKPPDPSRLVESIRAALDADRRARVRSGRLAALARGLDAFDPREHRVLQMMLHGEPNKRIASRLRVSHRTVDRVRASILEKTGAASVIELARMVAELEAERELAQADRPGIAAGPFTADGDGEDRRRTCGGRPRAFEARQMALRDA